MFINAECPDCGTRYRLKEALAGRSARCKKCGLSFTIESLDAPAIQMAPEPESQSAPPSRSRATTAAAPRGYAAPPPTVSAPTPPGSVSGPVMPYRALTAYRENHDVGLDPLSPLLLLILIGLSIAGGAYAHYQLANLPEGSPVSAGVVWSAVIAQLVLFFAFVGPAVLLGIFIVSRIFKFRLPASAYVRACGVAAVPAVIAALKTVLPANPVLIVLLALAIVPITFYVMKQIFSLKLGEAALSLVFSGILFIIAQGLTLVIVAVVIVGGVFADQAQKQSVAQTSAPGGFALPGGMSGNAGQPAMPTKSPEELARERLAALKSQILAFNASRGGEQSREKLAAQVAAYEATLESLRSPLGSTGAFIETNAAIKEANELAASAPSEKAPPDLFEPLKPTQSFDPESSLLASLGDELSFADYKLRPPASAVLDLKTSMPNGDSLTWTFGDSGRGRLSIQTIKRANTAQNQPWPMTRPWMAATAREQNLLAYESDQLATVGTIGTVAFSEISLPGSTPGAPGGLVYASPQGDEWLIIEIQSAGDAQTLATLRASARSLRDARGEAKSDPFSPERIAPRLADAPEQATDVLRQHGNAAEDAVLAQLESAKDKRVIVALLADIGTAKSVPALQKYANDFFAGEAARNAIQELDPQAGDATAMALLDLETGDVFKKREAMKTLAAAETVPSVDDPQRIKIATLLEKMILEGGAFDAEAAGPALAKWHREETVSQLLPTIEAQRPWLSNEQKGAMIALAGTRDERAVFPIARWLINNPEETVAALKSMGEVAEAKVIPLLKEKNAVARKGAAQVLEEIGTIKSIQGLSRAANDPRDADAKATAQRALEAVRSRVMAERDAEDTAAPITP